VNDEPIKADIDKQWSENPLLIKQFIDCRPEYEQLCSEVAYILRTKLKKAEIEVAAVTFRAKTLASFLEKTRRKPYKNPLTEITDIAGVRVVCLYSPDTSEVQKLIRKEFDLVEEVDKLKEKSSEEFGYSAKHFIIRLGKSSSGARYDDLKNLVCEIQVRTVLQDAWAIIQHHLVYKKEADVPEALQRKLNSLSGLLETADDQFDSIRRERLAYLKTLERSKNEPDDFLKADFNMDSFTAYARWKFPHLKLENFTGQAKIVFSMMKKDEHPSLKDLDQIVEANKDVLRKMEKEYEQLDTKFRKFDAPSAAVLVMYAPAIINARWASEQGLGSASKILVKKYNKWK